MGLTVAAVTYSNSLARPDPRIKLSEVSGANILHRVLRKLNLEKQRHRDTETQTQRDTQTDNKDQGVTFPGSKVNLVIQQIIIQLFGSTN